MVVLRIKEKLKIFWKRYKENWLWVNIGGYIVLASMNWFLYFLGLVSLVIPIIYSLIFPPILISVYFTRKSSHRRIIYRLIWTIGGALVLGFPIWISINYILYVAPWAPFRDSDNILAIISFVLSPIISYGAAAYICHRLGKKRDFQPFMES